MVGRNTASSSPNDAPSATPQEATSSQPTQQLNDLQVPVEIVYLETRWYQLRDTVHSATLDVLRCARRQHQDSCDDNNSAINNLSAEKNRKPRNYLDSPASEKKAAFYQYHRLAPQPQQKMQDVWMVRKAAEIQGYANRIKSKKLSLPSDHRKWTAPQLRQIKASDGEPADSEAPGRTLLKRPQSSLHNNRRRYQSPHPSGNGRRPGSPALPSRNHPCSAKNLQRESTRLRCDPSLNLEERQPLADGLPLPEDVATRAGPSGL
ncbi:hypothetical protein SprV_0401505000 [Sparganum proliferum]